MKITLVAVGSIKEKFYKDAIEEYAKRLSRYCKLSIIELKDEKTPANSSISEEIKIKRIEGERILEKIPQRTYVIALTIDGKKYSSENLATHLAEVEIASKGNLYFVIGGSLGISEAVVKRANEKISFSDMTFPHQLMRVILLEQIYRSYRILHNEPYHK